MTGSIVMSLGLANTFLEKTYEGQHATKVLETCTLVVAVVYA